MREGEISEIKGLMLSGGEGRIMVIIRGSGQGR